jgi:hypothetical protein
VIAIAGRDNDYEFVIEVLYGIARPNSGIGHENYLT